MNKTAYSQEYSMCQLLLACLQEWLKRLSVMVFVLHIKLTYLLKVLKYITKLCIKITTMYYIVSKYRTCSVDFIYKQKFAMLYQTNPANNAINKDCNK